MGATMKPTDMNRAMIYSEPGTTKTELVELPIPKPGPGEVLVRLWFSGVCHTDYGICTNSFPNLQNSTPKGQVGGHEGYFYLPKSTRDSSLLNHDILGVGEVVELGPGVAYPPLGEKVGIKWAADACLSCDRCLAGGETSCSSGKISGLFTPGTFQQYVLGPAAYVTPIPSSVTDLAGVAPIMCGGITVYAALKRARVSPSDWVLVTGAGGGLGHLAVQYGKAFGARILALDHGSKEALCRELGADDFLDFTQSSEAELREEVHRVTGGGATTVIACASSNGAYAQAVGFLGFRGTLVCLGVPEGARMPIGGAIVEDMIRLELHIFGRFPIFLPS
ncbi:hypothetical protein BP6252_05522 [Coleophoma cylindrospora]|uniref:Enoyl reductase (ER) domain-containing protein n=1 Tax=Coleophoma cylindrospora TaxID=1849047 RepID=A0A3D8RTU5_9HELO|nr:hypothetical protein BP6252_05522 [Coleophoma cylindrospora]